MEALFFLLFAQQTNEVLQKKSCQMIIISNIVSMRREMEKPKN
jgi:hypothetical protein